MDLTSILAIKVQSITHDDQGGDVMIGPTLIFTNIFGN